MSKVSEYVERELLRIAELAAMNARPKNSGYRIGAAIYDSHSGWHRGCNIEFDTYSLTIHAEAAAIGSMCTTSSDAKILAIAVWTTGSSKWMPCGACRQIISEMASPNAIVLAGNSKNYDKILIKDLLPGGAYSLNGKNKNKNEKGNSNRAK